MTIKIVLFVWLISIIISARALSIGIRKLFNRYSELEFYPIASLFLVLSILWSFIPLINLIWSIEFALNPYKYIEESK